MSNHNELLASQRILSMLESACENSERTLDNIPSVFVVLNQDNRVIRANKAFCDLVGCTMEGALHLDFSAFFTAENRAILLHHFNHVRQSGHHQNANARVKLEFGGHQANTPAKPFFWRLSAVEHLSEADGEVISIIGDDLSSLYQSELKLTSIFASIPLGLMVVDSHGNIVEVMSEYCHVLLNERTLADQPLHAILKRHNPEMHAELGQAFDVLQHSVGKPNSHWVDREAVLNRLGHLKITGEAERWIKPRFQPILKNNVVDRYMVILEDNTAHHLAQKQIEKADMLGKQAQALYECAIRDPLSGLYTRLFMNDSVSRLVSSARRGNLHELSLVMFDLDNFKSVNDTHGHDAGDKVIQAFGRIVRACTRDTDIAVRYGGEEFLLALPCNDTREAGGAIVAERIRLKLEQTPVDIGGGKTVHVTTSSGVAYCHATDTLESMINRADKYLYIAKRNGKNRVCVCIDKTEGE